ncbi:MAG: pentapeptide repeat-containing protein [Cyanobacteria bacterium P01_H01_bin.150]
MPDSKLPEQRDIKTEGGNYAEHINGNYIQADTVNVYGQNGCDTRNVATQKVAGKKQLAFVLTGTIGDVDKAKLRAIQAHLRKISGDAELTIIDVEEGSIRLKLEGSPEGLKKLQELFESEELTEVLGIPVKDVYFTSNEIEDFEENTENGDKFRLVQEILKNGAVGRDLSDVDLSGANLGSVNLNRVNLSNSNLSGVNFSGDSFGDYMFIGANLSRSNLSCADLSSANLSRANLSRANLSNANLSNANLSNADLNGANLSGTNLSGASVENAFFMYNIGISEELKFDLTQRGAIFKDSPGENSPIYSPIPSRS